jgi:hypothetical protein
VPILSLSTAGGYSGITHLTLDFVGSTDVSILQIQLLSDEAAALDIGHIDLWTAIEADGNARDLVWQPILEWIGGHTCREEVDVLPLASNASK